MTVQGQEQAIDALRRGRPILIADEKGGFWPILSLDMAGEESLARFEAQLGRQAQPLLSQRRAAVLHLTAQRAGSGAAVLLERPKEMDLAQLVALADSVQDLALPFKGPLVCVEIEDAAAARAALTLLKAARLLPAALTIWPPLHAPAADWPCVAATEALAGVSPMDLTLVARAKLPLALAVDAQIAAFRTGDGGWEHLAVVVGDVRADVPVLVRLHSECFTGDLLGSLKCDCGPQWQGALAAVAAAGTGILLYMGQEGRGIGLINKLRAYALQDQGFDTIDANYRLGFEADERLFAPAARMLHLLGVGPVRLLTNNPDKVLGLQAAGVNVVARVAHQLGETAQNRDYLRTKQQRSGHFLTGFEADSAEE